MELVVAVFLGACLAAASGFRAFLPLFCLGVVYRLHSEYGLPLGPFLPATTTHAWVASDAAILCFGVATAFEVLADKIPGFDHTLDAFLAFVRPGAGAVSVFSLLNTQEPVVAYAVAIIVGVGASLPVQALKAGGRAAANTLSLGAAAPILSIAEDLGAATLVLLVIAPFIAVITGGACYFFFRRFRSRRLRMASATQDVNSPT